MSASPSVSVSDLRVSFQADRGRTHLARLHEAGALRLRQPRGPTCEVVLVNTGGGIVAGDCLALSVDCGPGSAATVTSVAAEKVYRSAGATAQIDATLRLAAGSRLDWLPQETILFDGARLSRRFSIDLAAGATLVVAEVIVFGRIAHGERMRAGALRDSWRVRRDGRLVFADETALDAPIDIALDRAAVGAGARAVALLLCVGPDVGARLEPLRNALALFDSASDDGVESGASRRDGILVARLVSRSPERLRAAMVAALDAVRPSPLPRIWL